MISNLKKLHMFWCRRCSMVKPYCSEDPKQERPHALGILLQALSGRQLPGQGVEVPHTHAHTCRAWG